MISGATDGAIFGMRWAERATADLATNASRDFPSLLISGNRVNP
jgi:hypothetical protein